MVWSQYYKPSNECMSANDKDNILTKFCTLNINSSENQCSGTVCKQNSSNYFLLKVFWKCKPMPWQETKKSITLDNL